MIGIIKGVVLEGCVLTSSGVGYDVMTTRDLVDGELVTLLVESVSNNNSIRLFGFRNHDEKNAFNYLLKVPTVGPVASINIIKVLGVEGLCKAVLTKDTEALKKVRGVSIRSAISIIGVFKVAQFSHVLSQDSITRNSDELFETLCDLGYDKVKVRATLSTIDPKESEEVKLNIAIKALALTEKAPEKAPEKG